MLLLNEISYQVIPHEGMAKTLREFPAGDVAFDYETFNTRDGELAKEPWDEDTHPFLFSVCAIDNPENTLKVFQVNAFGPAEKAALDAFLSSRRVWAFNCKFEGAVTSKLLGKFVLFDDVQCLYKVDGRFINGLSLKKGTAQLMKVPEWADATWETYEALRGIVKRVRETWVEKRKANELIELFLQADVRKLCQLIEYQLEAKVEMTKETKTFCELLIRVKPFLTPQLILAALTASQMNPAKITLKYVEPEIVERYAAYDAYATACCYLELYKGCEAQYPYYIKQAHLAMTMEAYGMTRDLAREAEIEKHYKDQILDYMKKILRIKQFSDLLRIDYTVREINPASGRLKQMPYSRVGLELEDGIAIDSATDYEELMEKYYNYRATLRDKVRVFYDALFSSEKAYSAVMVYHIKKLFVQVEGFTEIVDGQEMHKARNMSYNTDNAFLNETKAYVEDRLRAAKDALDAKTGNSKLFYSKASLQKLKIADDDPALVEYKKWDKMLYNIKKTIQEALSLVIAPPGEKTKEEDRDATTEDIRFSLKKENMEILYSALSECAGMQVDVPWDEMEWEMQLVFCCKTLRKLDKALNSYVQGRVGRERVRKCVFGGDLRQVPARMLNGPHNLFQTSFNDCSADTKRWRSPIHAIPRGCELSEMIVPRLMDSILVHYDYCWHKDTKIKLYYDEGSKTIEELYNKQSKDSLMSYSKTYGGRAIGNIKEVRKVRVEKKLLELTLNNGFKLKLTPEHNLYKVGYVKTPASELKVGDVLLSYDTLPDIESWRADGNMLAVALLEMQENAGMFRNSYQPSTLSHCIKIAAINEVEYNDWVYTIEVFEKHHNYFVIASDDERSIILSSNSQAEVRVIAALAKEHDLLRLFNDNPKADVHRLMASRVWNKKPEEVSGEQRKASKGLVFGSLYGMSLESMAATYFNSNITVARDVYTKFFTAYPKILSWCSEQHKQVDKHKYVYTIFGDKIWIESKSRGELHRRSQNYPVQSSSSTIAGYGIWNVWEYCNREKIEAIPQCFIHDSSDWDVRLPDLIKFIKAVDKCAVEDLAKQFNIPMKIDFEIGINLNFTMHLENPEFVENSVHCEFKCPEVFYRQLMERLALAYAIEHQITKEEVETESWGNLFVTKRPYSMYINRPIKIFSGSLGLTPKIGYIQ